MKNEIKENFKNLETIRDNIKRNFSTYKKTLDHDRVPDLSDFFDNCKSKVDLDSFLKTILHGCRDLICSESNTTKEQLANYLIELRKWLKEIIKEEKLKEESLANIFAWFDFHISQLREFKNGLRDFEKLCEWLRICYDTNDKDAAHFFVFFELNRDEEMRQIVFDAGGLVREFFRDPQLPGYVYLDKLATWFLVRYDLDAAFSILNVSTTSPIHTSKLYRIGEGCWQRLLLKSLAFWLSIVTTFFLFFGTTNLIIYRDTKKYWAEIVSQATFARWSPTIDSLNIKTWIILPYQLIVALLIVVAFIICLIRWRHIGWYNLLRRILPRLFGGILVGYIPLMSSEDLWKWLLTLPTAPAIGIWLLALVFSYVYLCVEARGALSDCAISAPVKRDIAIRSGQVFLIGLAEAYIIGVILCEFLGYTALKGLGQALQALETQYVIKGWIGTLVPKVILLYAPLALFLGILVQLIWEEKTVTQPL